MSARSMETGGHLGRHVFDARVDPILPGAEAEDADACETKHERGLASTYDAFSDPRDPETQIWI